MHKRITALGGVAALCLALSGMTGVAHAAPAAGPTVTNDVTHVTTSFPASVIAQAATVHVVADLANVSAATKAYIQTPVTETDTKTMTPMATTRAVIHSDASGVNPPGCYSVQETKEHKNALGWVLTYAQTYIHNWCFTRNLYGYLVMTTTPNMQPITWANWGWSACGVTNQYANWISIWVQFEAAATYGFDPGVCVGPRVLADGETLYVYGSGLWQTY